MSVKLYSYFRSSASYRVRIALYLKNISFDYAPIHLLKSGGEQLKDNYKKLNPMAQVPTLEHDGKLLSQSMAIVQYIDQQWPSTPLFPSDVYQKAKVIEICEAINSGIQPLQNLSVLNYISKDMCLGEEAKTKWAVHWITLGLEKLERLLESTAGTYCLGGQVSAADLFLVPQIYGSNRYNIEMKNYPTLSRINAHCTNQEAFQKAHPENQPDYVK